MTKFTIETDKFKDENELNIFIANVIDMRKAQSDLEVNKWIEAEQFDHLMETAKLFEKQVDDALQAMPPITALFF